jgi:hypothetical protein
MHGREGRGERGRGDESSALEPAHGNRRAVRRGAMAHFETLAKGTVRHTEVPRRPVVGVTDCPPCGRRVFAPRLQLGSSPHVIGHAVTICFFPAGSEADTGAPRRPPLETYLHHAVIDKVVAFICAALRALTSLITTTWAGLVLEQLDRPYGRRDLCVRHGGRAGKPNRRQPRRIQQRQPLVPLASPPRAPLPGRR